MTRKSLVAIAPVFNEEQVIERFYASLEAVLSALADRYDPTMMFVVDRSSDRTLEILKGIAARDPRVRVVALSSRFGHQMSLLAGIDLAPDADAIVMLDSDMQHPPETIPEMLRAYEDGHDIVYTVRGDAADTTAARRWAGSLFYRLLTVMSRVPINENAADFRLISGQVARVIRQEIRERNMFLRGIFSWMGFRQKAVHFTAAPRAGGRSKYTLSRMMALATAAILSFSTRPLHAGIFLGLGVAAASVLLMVFTVVEYFIDSSIPSGWTTLAMLVLIFSSVQLLVMGILGAYIGGIYEEVKRRPHYIVEEKINFEG
jgi:glycosyltransferase involved in cell wall biosynthesis